jgi:tetratricopeptide (TPR) repeat protein
MAVTIEGYSVVAQRERMEHLLEAGDVPTPNATALGDAHLWRCCFMVYQDARDYCAQLESLGLNVSQGPDSDVVIIDEYERTAEPYCEWLVTAQWENAVIAWLAGTDPKKLTVREGWTPQKGSGLQRGEAIGLSELELLGLDGNVEVYRHKQTGKKHYIGRTSTPADSMFQLATQTIRSHWRQPGQPPLTGKPASDVQDALEILQKCVAERPDEWRLHWFLGKGRAFLGDPPAAYESFRRAYDLACDEEPISRELAGICLELGKAEEAVGYAERSATVHPDNHEVIANLALTHLMAGNPTAAAKSIQAALKLAPNDDANRAIAGLINDVIGGRRLAPAKLSDVYGSPRPKRWWQFWK